jgi:hypothetical protein
MRRKASKAILRETGQPVWQARTTPTDADPLKDARQQF